MPSTPEAKVSLAPTDPAATPAALNLSQGLRYGGLGLPLAFVALPLYVVLPNHYASQFGVPLAWLGAVLLAARLLDAVADPWIGRRVDGLFERGVGAAWGAAAIAAALLAAGFGALFLPPRQIAGHWPWLLVWCAAGLGLTYLSYSVASVVHQAWGARLGGSEAQRARIVAWREGLALVGVLMASVLPSVAGLGVTSLAFALLLGVGMVLLWFAPKAVQAAPALLRTREAGISPFASSGFRRLLGIYLVNGIASAIPATLVLFFIRDRLQATSHEPMFLASYFAAAALSIPLWVRVVGRLGLARAWLVGMGLAIGVFLWAIGLGAGDVVAYTVVCALSGIALGADLTLPGALLTGVIRQAGHSGRAEGAYLGWWNFATKLNLALAAGVGLPALQAFGYAPGSRDPDALQALTAAYCLLPCLLKLLAAALLWRLWLCRPESVTVAEASHPAHNPVT